MKKRGADRRKKRRVFDFQVGTGKNRRTGKDRRRQLELLMDEAVYFDGETYVHGRDHKRLGAQLLRVWEAMKSGSWMTLGAIASATGDPQPSVSARLRDFRKMRFGAHEVERRYVKRGLHEYRLVRRTNENRC